MGRQVPSPRLLASDQTKAGHAMQQAGGLPPGPNGRPPGLIVRYAACGGLFNQHYCHIAGIAMAIALGAEAIVSLAISSSWSLSKLGMTVVSSCC